MSEITKIVVPVQVDFVCDKCGNGMMRPTGEITMEKGITRHRCTSEGCRSEVDFKDITYPYIRYKSEEVESSQTEVPAPNPSLMESDPGETVVEEDPTSVMEPVAETEPEDVPGPVATPEPVPDPMPEPTPEAEPQSPIEEEAIRASILDGTVPLPTGLVPPEDLGV